MLHIIPLPDDSSNLPVDYRSPNLTRDIPIDPSTGAPSPFAKVNVILLEEIIEAFHAGDEDWFRENLAISS
jgi:hypothetical protein